MADKEHAPPQAIPAMSPATRLQAQYAMGRPPKRPNPLHDRSAAAPSGEAAVNSARPLKAYVNRDFLFSPAARQLRILCEYEEPRNRFAAFGVHNTIAFFGSARVHSVADTQAALDRAKAAVAKDGADADAKADVIKYTRQLKLAPYYDKTRALSRRLAEWSAGKEGPKYHIMTGGGPGMMQAANQGAHDAGAENCGLSISLPFEDTVNEYVSPHLAFEFHYFFTRKLWLLYFTRALIISPGGVGTLDELFEALTLVQCGKIKKRMAIVLLGKSYWEQVITFETMAEHGVISDRDLSLFHMTDDVDDAFNYISQELVKNEGQGQGAHSAFEDVDSAFQNVLEDEAADAAKADKKRAKKQ